MIDVDFVIAIHDEILASTSVSNDSYLPQNHCGQDTYKLTWLTPVRCTNAYSTTTYS